MCLFGVSFVMCVYRKVSGTLGRSLVLFLLGLELPDTWVAWCVFKNPFWNHYDDNFLGELL